MPILVTQPVNTVVYPVEPLHDPRWPRFVERCPRSSVFHTASWLEALRRTYGYRPIAYTTSHPGEELRSGLLVCYVESWITGRRLVSLPFSDHCEPLAENVDNVDALVSAVGKTLRPEGLRYVELRAMQPPAAPAGLYHSTRSYCFHYIDLGPDLATLFANCHKSSTQRKILRAERERLVYESGREARLLDAFWDLLLITRRRHSIPPQPKSWFQNLIECFGEALQIRVAFEDKHAVAAILTLRHKDTLVYKYGCSDPRFSTLGGTHLLFWRSVEEAKRAGLRVFDLGRSDLDNPGLITFKDRWGSTRSTLVYSRFSASPPASGLVRTGAAWAGRVGKCLIGRLPGPLFRMVGRAVYRHVA